MGWSPRQVPPKVHQPLYLGQYLIESIDKHPPPPRRCLGTPLVGKLILPSGVEDESKRDQYY